MSKVPKLPLSRLKLNPGTANSTSPMKPISRKTSLCATPQRSQSLENSALHFQPRALKSLAHERALYKQLRLIQTDREQSCEDWQLKVTVVASQWRRMNSLGTRRKPPFSLVAHFAGSPRKLSAERGPSETPQQLLSLAEATNTALKQAIKAHKPPEIPVKSTHKSKTSKSNDPRKSRTQRIEVPKLREKHEDNSNLPKSTHTKSCAQLTCPARKPTKTSLLMRLQTPVLTGRK